MPRHCPISAAQGFAAAAWAVVGLGMDPHGGARRRAARVDAIPSVSRTQERGGRYWIFKVNIMKCQVQLTRAWKSTESSKWS